MKRNFTHVSPNCFVLLYKSLVRSHIEYANSVWNTHYIENHRKIEQVQMRATKLIQGLKGLSYTQRLIRLKLPTLKFRRLRGDMIEIYKMLTGNYDKDSCIKFKFVNYPGTQPRGNKLQIYQDHVHYKLRKYFFANRVIHTWNSLPNAVVEASSINSFKNRLDKYWINEEFKFNWEADLSGTGSRT